MNIKEKIKKNLDEYLGFNSNLIFNSKIDNGKKSLIRIFGGAIRDIIADMPINDVDIIVGARSMSGLESVLKENGYKYLESLHPKDLSNIYTDIKVINEPHTWVKDSKIVQLIRPVIDSQIEKKYQEGFVNLIQNVDISCCGVSYDGLNVYENYPSAISHCLTKSYSVNKSAKMYSKSRFIHRMYKLEDRGWKEVITLSERRNQIINSLLNLENINYIKEYVNMNIL
jgi:hypothetical protein